MPANQSGPRIEAIARKWHDLAERRVVYYNELYRSGRWERYFQSREQFALRMLDVIAVAKVFRHLADRPTTAPLRRDDLRSAA